MKYRKRPIVIDAVQFNGFNKSDGKVSFDHRPEWLAKQFGVKIMFFDARDTLTIKTLEGDIPGQC